MTGRTHLAAGALSALVAYKLGLSHQPIELVIGALATACLPDVDQQVKLLRHRGPSHSLLWPIILIIASGYYSQSLLLGAAIGLISHLLIDLFNGKGIEIIWPISDKNYRIADIKYDGIMENIGFVVMMISIATLIVSNYVRIDVTLVTGLIK